MSRVQLALNVENLDTAVAFYTKLLGSQPAKRKPGYANFALDQPPLKLVLIENPGHGGTVNHLGVETDTSEHVRREAQRLAAEGLITLEEENTTCCYATQDKVWATAPDGEQWEIYTVLAHTDVFGSSPDLLVQRSEAVCCAGSTE